MLRWLGTLLALLPVVILGTGFSEAWLSPNDNLGTPMPGAKPSPTSYPLLDALLAHASDQVKAGAATFHLLCATCHGPTGAGMAEARLAFDPQHRHCERCHAPSNPPLRRDMRITPNQTFSIGRPPPLRSAALLDRYPTASYLFAFVHGKMPRYDPGMLGSRQTVQVVAFLLALNHAMPPGSTLVGPDAALEVKGSP
ncbi:MAG: hypothetical protein P8Z81_04205 [Deinococcales bacterium]|jgi:hypothetical protein